MALVLLTAVFAIWAPILTGIYWNNKLRISMRQRTIYPVYSLPPTLKAKEKKEWKEKKKGAIPKTTPPAASSLPIFSSSSQYDQAGMPPNTQDEIIRLQLMKDNHDRDTQIRIASPVGTTREQDGRLNTDRSI